MITIIKIILIIVGILLLLSIISIMAFFIYGWCYCNLKYCKHCNTFMKRHNDDYEDFVGLGRQYSMRFECPNCHRWAYKIPYINEEEKRHVQKNPLLREGIFTSINKSLNILHDEIGDYEYYNTNDIRIRERLGKYD